MSVQEKIINEMENLPKTGRMKFIETIPFFDEWDFKRYRATTDLKSFRNKFERELKTFIGKDWKEVFEFFKTKYPEATVPKLKNIEHYLEREIEIRTILKDGLIYSQQAPGWYAPRPISSGYYVHPETNKLCFINKRPKQAGTPNYSTYNVTGGKYVGSQLQRLNGIWYVTWKEEERYWHTSYECYMLGTKEKFKQLNKKELKSFDLKND